MHGWNPHPLLRGPLGPLHPEPRGCAIVPPRSWPSACPAFWVLVEDPGGLGQRQTTVCQAWLGQQPGRDFPALFPEHHPAGGMDRPRDSRGQGGLRHTEKLRSGLRTPVEGTVYLLPRTT